MDDPDYRLQLQLLVTCGQVHALQRRVALLEHKVMELTEALTGSDRLLTVKEAAVYAGYSRSKIYEWMKDSALPYCRVGAQRRIRLSVLKEWLSERFESQD